MTIESQVAPKPQSAHAKAQRTDSEIFVGIQMLRGLAASMVVVHHYVASQAERGAELGRWWHEFGGSGVDIFFVISGFIMMITQSDPSGQRNYSAKKFLTRRLLRIAPLYWVLTALAFGMASLAGAAVNTQIPFDKFVMSMLFLPYSPGPISMSDTAHLAYVIPMAWTLTFEWFFYLVFAAALAFGLQAFAQLRFIAATFIALIAAGILARPETPILQVVTSPLLIEFLLGCLVATMYRKGVRMPAWIALPVALVAVGILTNQLHGNVFERTAIWGLASFALISAASLNRREIALSLVTRPFARLGDISYSLYLSHFFTLALFVRIQDRVPLLAESFGWLTLAAFVLLNLFGAEMCYRFIENPARRFFARADFGWLRPKRKAA
jgi:exopolysaccharide production protein ExoZ